MDLVHYLRILWRRKWIILLTAVGTFVAVYIGVSRIQPTYSTTAKIRLTTARSGAEDFLQYDIFYTDRLMNTYASIAQTSRYTEEMMDRLELDTFPSIGVTVVPNTELLEINVVDADPVLASEVANTLAEVLVENSTQISATTLSQGENSNNSEQNIPVTTVSIVETAWIPTDPDSPNRRLFYLLGAISGVVAGVGLALFFENFDDRLYEVEQIERITRRPIIGRIPTAYTRKQKQFLGAIYPHAEAFRHLRTQLFAATEDMEFLHLLITSAEPEEGKSTVISNLAFTIARTGKRTIVIDSDMRLPAMHTLFDVSNSIGLSQYLNDECTTTDIIQKSVFPGIDVITSGPIPDNPSELLASHRMKDLLAELNQSYDVILVDAPAFLPVTDAGILAQIIDNVILIVEQSATSGKAVKSTCSQLAFLHVQVLGVVVNKTQPLSTHGYHYIPQETPEPSTNNKNPKSKTPDTRTRFTSRKFLEHTSVQRWLRTLKL